MVTLDTGQAQEKLLSIATPRMLNVIKLSEITVNRHSRRGETLIREMMSIRMTPAFA